MLFRQRLSVTALQDAIARYHANAITTVQVLEELIQLAKDIRAARERGEESGLSDEEIAFYDALAQNGSAREVMGEPQLRVIAHELMTSVKNTVTGGLDAPGGGTGKNARACEKNPAQVRISAGPSGHSRANRVATGGSTVRGMGRRVMIKNCCRAVLAIRAAPGVNRVVPLEAACRTSRSWLGTRSTERLGHSLAAVKILLQSKN